MRVNSSRSRRARRGIDGARRHRRIGACGLIVKGGANDDQKTIFVEASATQIPAALLPYGTQLPAPIAVLIADVTYSYQPIFSQSLLKFSPVMQQTEYMLPRATGQVATGALPSSGSQYGALCY